MYLENIKELSGASNISERGMRKKGPTQFSLNYLGSMKSE
jgi:hypothetical protein